jgi:uncharacterized membrane protein YbhN (UPF0104 family)
MAGMIPTGPGEEPENGSARPVRDRRRTAIGLVFLAAVLVAAAVAVFDEHRSFAAAISKIGPVPVILSLAFGFLGVASALPVWHEVLEGVGARMPWLDGARVLFVSQLGKYLPGSVWPVLMQMEAGHARGIHRRTMLGANLITVAIACCSGIALACVLLPFYDSGALARYWWVLLALPFLLALLHPRALPALLDWAFALFGRPRLGERLDPRSEVRACAWSLAGWFAYGAQLAVLAWAVGASGFSTFLLCTGAAALAIPVGILFLPAPAGAGVREVVLVLVLSTMLSTGEALAVVLASRAILIVCDLGCAGIGALAGTHRRRRSRVGAS